MSIEWTEVKVHEVNMLKVPVEVFLLLKFLTKTHHVFVKQMC